MDLILYLTSLLAIVFLVVIVYQMGGIIEINGRRFSASVLVKKDLTQFCQHLQKGPPPTSWCHWLAMNGTAADAEISVAIDAEFGERVGRLATAIKILKACSDLKSLSDTNKERVRRALQGLSKELIEDIARYSEHIPDKISECINLGILIDPVRMKLSPAARKDYDVGWLDRIRKLDPPGSGGIA